MLKERKDCTPLYNQLAGRVTTMLMAYRHRELSSFELHEFVSRD